MRRAGLYVHIPYCIRKCAYCDFVSVPSCGVPETYLDALLREAAQTEDFRDTVFDTVFFGGGTPSVLTGAQMERLLTGLKERLPIAPDAEITAECNPGTMSEEKLDAFYRAGVNRLSIGLQSADDGLLKRIGRIHTNADFLFTAKAAKRAGFKKLNADVMCGLPGQTQGQYLDTLREVTSLGFTHVSAYSLILEEGTPLYRSVTEGKIKLPDEDTVADMIDIGMDFLNENGFIRYEISNYAKAGCECRHNVRYWENGEYLGLGVAAHSAFRRQSADRDAAEWVRKRNTEDIAAYLSMAETRFCPEEETAIGRAEEMFETVMVGLRMVNGISVGTFEQRFGIPLTDVYGEAIEGLAACGWLNEELFAHGRLALNRRGLDMENAALQLFMEK